MRSILTLIFIFIATVLLSGCAASKFKVEDNIKEEEGIFVSKTYKDESIKGYTKEIKEKRTLLAFKKGMEDLSLFAKKENKNFVIVNNEMNNLLGFPINDYSTLKAYCFNNNRDKSIKINCESMTKLQGIIKINFLLVDNSDYKIVSYNPDEVIESIKNEQ